MFALLSLALAASFPVQGHVTDTAGVPLQGTRSVILRLYTSPATPAAEAPWSETDSVAFQDGAFQTALGDGVAVPENLLTGDLWLGVTVAGVESERVAVGWAPRAAYAADAGRVGGQTLAELDSRFARINPGSAQSGALTVSGTVTAGGFAGDGSALTNLSISSLNVGAGALGQVLTSQGAGLAPTWQDVADPTWLAATGGIAYGGGSVGVGTTTPDASIHTTGGLRLGNDGGACNASRAGTLKFATEALWVCNGSAWMVVDLVSPAANVVLVSGTGSGMNVAGPGSPAVGTPVTFTYQNIGIENTAPISTSLANPTNFEITANTCTNVVLGRNATCSVTVRPRASANGAIVGSLNLTW